MSAPRLVGRESELQSLKKMLDDAVGGKGSSIIVSGEAGIGKSTLVGELRAYALERGARVLMGAAAADSGHPFLLISSAFAGHGGEALFDTGEHASFSKVFAIDPAGQLIAAVSPGSRDEGAGALAGMLSAVQGFVRDSFQGGSGKGSLGRLEYGDMKILIEHEERLFLAAVVKEAEHPEMRHALRLAAHDLESKFGAVIEKWNGRDGYLSPVKGALIPLLERRFAVRREHEGVSLEGERARIAEGAQKLVAGLARERPLLLVLEDVHWADESSLFVLGYVARNAAGLGALIVATRRPEEGRASIAGLGIAELRLGRLDTPAAAGIARSLFEPNDFPAEFLSRLSEQGGGNPFFIVETLRRMRDEGSISFKAGAYSLVREDCAIPDSVEAVVQARLSALEPDAMSMAEYASCLGREFDIDAALSNATLKSASRALAKLREAGIVLGDEGRGRFSHALFQDVVYRGISGRWKSAHHKSLGEYYEARHAGATDDVLYELARHFSRTSEHRKAFEYSFRSGEKAEGSFAAEQALELYKSALGFLPKAGAVPPGTESVLRERIGDCYKSLGEPPLAMAEYGALLAAHSSDPDGYIRIILKMDEIAFHLRDRKEVSRLLGLGSVMAPRAGPEAAAEFYSRQALDVHDTDPKEASELASLALEKLSAVSDRRTVAKVHITLGQVRDGLGGYADAVPLVIKAIEIAEGLGDARILASAYEQMGSMRHSHGEFASAIKMQEKALALRERMGDVFGMFSIYINLGNASADFNMPERATECHRSALAIGRRLGNDPMMAMALGNLGYALSMTGRNEEALATQSEALALRQGYDGKLGIGWSYSDLAIVHINLGNLGEAEDCALKSLGEWEPLGYDMGVSIAHLMLGNILSANGERDGAIEHYNMSLEIARRCDLIVEKFSSLAELVDLSAVPDVTEAFRELDALSAKIGRPDFQATVARLKACEALKSGDHARAHGILDSELALNAGQKGIEAELSRASLLRASARALAAQGEAGKGRATAAESAALFRKAGRLLEAGKSEELARTL
ncbi:MAG: tetratricopeptide repeat protein [Euryarchaeota archaeon]|nr:tetratricopeptide repeat protein [Euryarchaeota archaeon]